MVSGEDLKRFALPDLGEGLTEAEIVRWLVSTGDTVTLNQPIVEVETAKALVEIPAKWAGTVREILCAEGATVAVGTPIIAIAVDGPPDAAAAQPRPAVLVGYGPKQSSVARRPRRIAEPADTAGSRDAMSSTSTTSSAAPATAKPPVRRLARELGLDLSTVTGTGPGGLITREDALLTASHPAPPPAERGQRRVAVRGVHRTTARNLTASAFTAPHATVFLTVDMTWSLRALARIGARPQWRGVRTSPLLLVARASVTALRRHPMLNATWIEDAEGPAVVVKDYVDLGIAAATERGLVVPHIRDCEQLSLRDLAGAIAHVTGTARAGRSTQAELAGGTFTITNVGVFGVDTAIPILPPGQAAILALGTVSQRPWVHKGRLRPRMVGTLALTFDHRVVDGEQAALFLREVAAVLTEPLGSI